jgi:hypothetical protein
MNILPKELENIILDYKNQLDLSEKITENINKEIKQLNIKYIKFNNLYNDNRYIINNAYRKIYYKNKKKIYININYYKNKYNEVLEIKSPNLIVNNINKNYNSININN